MQRHMPRNCPDGHMSVIILNKDAAVDLELELDFWSQREWNCANRDITRTGTRQPRSAHHNVNEDRLAQAGQVLRCCFPRIRITCDTELNSLSVSISSADPFQIEICQIHVSVRQYVHGEDIFPSAQMDFEELRSQIPMVPLTPGKRVCRVTRCRDLQGAGCVFSVHIE